MLAPGGMTSIGDGIGVALGALGPVGANQRALLLMTDGLQNTPPMIVDVEAGLGATKLVAIGFGAESDLDSALLSRVARAHNGLYTRANDGLESEEVLLARLRQHFREPAPSAIPRSCCARATTRRKPSRSRSATRM